MEPMQRLALAKASMDVKAGKPHCLDCPWEIEGAFTPITSMLLPAGEDRATESPHTGTPCRLLSVHFVRCPTFSNVSLSEGVTRCLVHRVCLVPKIMPDTYYPSDK